MASILPTGIILEDQQIADLIAKINSNADKVVGESKFKIPPPELPGLGLLSKLWIRQAEKSFIAYLAPIIVVKEVINAADAITQIPEKILAAKDFAQNPVQEILDVSVNPLLETDLFLPIKLVVGGNSSANFSNLKSLVDRSQSESLVPVSVLENPFPYVLGVTGAVPNPGEYTFRSNSNQDVVILISTSDYNGENISSSFSSLIPGDDITISKDSISQSWIIKQISQDSGYYSLSVTLKNKSVQQLERQIETQTAYVKVQQNTETSGKKALKSLIAPNGRIEFPIKITLPQILAISNITIPDSPLNKIVVEIGDFNKLPENSPLRRRIKILEDRSGWNFQNDVLNPMLNGEYPVIKFKPEEEKTEKDKAKEDLIYLAKLFDILINDPASFFTILVTYLKLLLLPLQIVVSTLVNAVKKVVEAPLTIFSFIVQLVTDPIKLLGDLIAEAILEEIRKYIQPALDAAKIDWKTEVLFVQEAGKEKGLGRLISDIIIGRFKCLNFDNPKGSKMFSSDPGAGGTGSTGSGGVEFTNYNYNFKYDGTAPEGGEVSFNSQNLGEVTSIKISTFDSDVNSVIPELISLTSGSEISVPLGDKVWLYRVLSFSPSPGNLTYFDYKVAISYNPDSNPSSSSNPLINPTNSAILSPGANNQNVSFNPSSPFLKCLVDNYLPIKVIAIWESVKGILGIIIGFAITIPSLLAAIIKSVLSGPGYSDIASVSDNTSSFILDKLASRESSRVPDGIVSKRQYLTLNPLDLVSLLDPNSQEAKGVIGFIDGLISEEGIDVILLTQVKKKFDEEGKTFDPNAISISKEDGSKISLVEYARNLKVLLTFAQRFSTSRTLNSNDSFLVSYFDGSTNPNSSVNPDGTTNPPGGNNYRQVSLKLDRASLNKYRLSRGETLDNSNSDIIVFIRDNIYVAKLALESFFG